MSKPVKHDRNLFNLDHTDSPDLEEVGGKALNLWHLTQQEFKVPPWFAICSRAYQAFLSFHDLKPSIAKILKQVDMEQRESVIQASDKIQALIHDCELPKDLGLEIGQVLANNFAPDTTFAVRSSAVSEDTAAASFAGQMDSFLYQRGVEQVCESIRDCWASAFTERVLIYRHSHQIPMFEERMGVVVQEMIAGDISGVTFTANPMNGDWECMSISATYGLGEGIVSGNVSSDTYLYQARNDSIECQVAAKEEWVQFDDALGRGTKQIPVALDDQNQQVFSDEKLRELIPTWKAIESYYGYPQDIEWTLAQGELFILQSRPITTLETWPGIPRLWDNSNIIESYSGVTTPLTFTFASEAYTMAYKQFCEIMGVSQSVIQENDDLFPNMIGLIRGRVYYNLISWYRILALFPGFQYNKAFMETMMGVKEVERYTPSENHDVSFSRKWGVLFPRLVKLLLGLVVNLYRIEGRIKRFDENFREIYGQHAKKNFDAMSTDALVSLYLELKRKLLFNWKPPLINDFYAMIFYGVLQKLVQKWVPDGGATLQNDLLCGEGGIESTEPTHAIMRMALMIRKDEELKAWFQKQDRDQLYQALQAQEDPAFMELRDAVDDYLDKYGYRCMEELKLESLSLNDDPGFLFSLIGNYISMENMDLAGMQARERQIRLDAEKKVKQNLRGMKDWIRKPLFSWVLKNARRFVKNRENMRFNRTKIFGLVRDMFNAVGRQFEAMHVLETSRDIYFLELNEIIGFVNGTSTTPELAKLAKLRKESFEGFSEQEPAEHFITYGPVWVGNQFQAEQKEDDSEVEDGILKGVGCCPGTLTAQVKIVRNSRDDVDLKGKILVADRTDPGWVPLFPTARGLLIERGSLLSHSAIVARELGIPTIVGVRHLMTTLEDGQVVEMDGSTGRINYQPEPSATSGADDV